MKAGWRWAAALVMTGAVWTGCKQSSGRDQSEQNNPGLDTPRQEDGATKPLPPPRPDSGPVTTDGGSDAGTPPVPDAGTPPASDAGTPPASDAGTPDAGPITITLPSAEGWQFLGTQHGGPARVYGVSADEGGNIWVAGGEEGLFLLAPDATEFRRFTLADGLRPYGYMPDGSAPPGEKYLKVISVAGGPAGTVFVGYEGLPGMGADHCESNWDGPTPDPARYKSGDADKVTLRADGTLEVAHYDIFSGPNVVRDEPRGREKLCNVLRIAYDRKTHSVWFGGNHGFARGDSRFTGNNTCNGQLSCSGVMEHVHPAINAYVYSNAAEDRKLHPNEPSRWRVQGALLTDAYYGVAVDPSGDVWFGGSDRSTRFRYGSTGYNYWRAQSMTEDKEYAWNRFDLWEDAVGEPAMSRPEQRTSDNVSGMAVMGDGTVWAGSFGRGLVQLDNKGHVLRQLSTELVDRKGYVSAVAGDPLDDSLWAGASWGGGISRVKGQNIVHYSLPVFGRDLVSARISDIQMDTSGGRRRVLVAFMGYERSDKQWVPGAIGIYTGN